MQSVTVTVVFTVLCTCVLLTLTSHKKGSLMEREQKVTCECTFECVNIYGDKARFWARIVIPHYPLNQEDRDILVAWLAQHDEVSKWSQVETAMLLEIRSLTVKVIEENITKEQLLRMYYLLTEFECVTRIPLP